jgi:hypothetical protein
VEESSFSPGNLQGIEFIIKLPVAKNYPSTHLFFLHKLFRKMFVSNLKHRISILPRSIEIGLLKSGSSGSQWPKSFLEDKLHRMYLQSL